MIQLNESTKYRKPPPYNALLSENVQFSIVKTGVSETNISFSITAHL